MTGHIVLSEQNINKKLGKIYAVGGSMLKIAYVSDLHGNKNLYEKVCEFLENNKDIKALIIGGDLLPRGATLDGAIRGQKEFLETYLIPKLKRIAIPVYLMMGNDDYRINMALLEKEEKAKAFRLIHNKAQAIGKHAIVGYSFVNETPFLLKDWEKLDDENSKPLTDPKHDVRSAPAEKGTIAQDMRGLAKLSDPKKTFYVFHCPPFETELDMLYDKRHVGSRSIRLFIEQHQPPATFHGHVHESPIVSGEYASTIGKTICFNPGSEYMDDLLTMVIADLDNPKEHEHEML